MSSLERVFIKEYKRAMRNSLVAKNIYNVPLPQEVNRWGILDGDTFVINGIPSDSAGLFSSLNKSIVKKLPSGVSPQRRKFDLVNRCFIKDSMGNFIYENVKIPSNSMVILSSVNLNLPYRYKANDTGFGYIDFIVNRGFKEYLYYVPKRYLYRSNQTALALSVKNMKNYFGKGYMTWKFGTVYLHIIPYKSSRNYVGTKILKTSHSLNYEKEVKAIVDFWVENDVIPNIALCNTIDEGNLVLKDTARGFDDYIPVEEMSLIDCEIYSNNVKEGDY